MIIDKLKKTKDCVEQLMESPSVTIQCKTSPTHGDISVSKTHETSRQASLSEGPNSAVKEFPTKRKSEAPAIASPTPSQKVKGKARKQREVHCMQIKRKDRACSLGR